MSTLSLRNVEKSFGATKVIRGVSLSIGDGEFVILVGPSGCGKSTLLRMVAGLEKATAGEIRIDDRLVNDVMAKDRDVAMVFQNYALYPHMTVAENMGFALKMQKVPPPEIRERVAEAAAVLDLAHLLDRRPRQLSGGQRQRVAMGRAIVRAPKVFLFDEPLSNLDAKLRVQMRTEIKELHQKLKTTIVYVTHDQVEAMTMADKIVVIRDGIVEQTGSPLELYDRPANRFVAGFIGSPAMNFIEGRVVSGTGAFFREESGVELPLAAVPDGLGADGAVYGIRPEHIHVDPDGGVDAMVAVVEPTGSETQVALRVGGQTLVGLFRERVALGPGDRIRLRFDAEKVHLFDPVTGRRL